MLHLEVEVAAADTARRLIEGVAVPYGETAHIAGGEYRFTPSSLRRARAVTPLLLGHDTNLPVGVLTGLTDDAAGVRATFRVDKTADGDRALEQAKSGSRGGLSIGFQVDDFEVAADGVIDITAAALYEVSLVAVPAFSGAQVERVAAQLETDPPAGDDGGQEDDAKDDDDDDDDEEETDGGAPDESKKEEETMDDHSAAAPRIMVAERERKRDLSAGELTVILIRAQHGEPDAIRLLQGALAETISTDVTGLLPPQYEKDVLGGKQVPRILYETFKSRALPGVGLAVNKPKWTTPPDGAWAATVDADATTSKAVIGSQAAAVERWDWAGAISWVVVQRSDPSIVDEIYSEAVQDFYLDVETKIAAEVNAAAVNAATTLGAGIAAFYAGTSRVPDLMLVAPDVWGELADAGALSQPVASGDVSTANGLRSSFGGIPITSSGMLAAGARILATKRSVDARVTEPVRLTANAIGALNVELAVVGEGMFDTDYPNELMALTPVTPADLAAQAKRSTGR